MDSSASALEPLFAFLSYALIQAEQAFLKIPGSHVIARYVKSSHQNDPGRTVLEVLLALFAIRTLLQSRTRADNGEKHFIQFSEKERLSLFFYGDAQYFV
jgi:serine palmitoyltransferase